MTTPNTPPTTPSAVPVPPLGPEHMTAPLPPTEVLPGPNQVLTREQWATDLSNLNYLQDRLLHFEERIVHTAGLQRQYAGSAGDLEKIDRRMAEFQAKRKACMDGMIGLARESDTTHMMREIQKRTKLAKTQQDERQETLAKHAAAADSRQAEATQAAVVLRQRKDANALAGDAATEFDHEVKRAADNLSTRADHLAEDAAHQRGVTEYRTGIKANFYQSMLEVASEITRQQRNANQLIMTAQDEAQSALESWGVGSNDQDAERQTVEAQLEILNNTIAGLSQHDSLRAKAVAITTRIQYRYHARRLAEPGADRVSSDLFYAEDGGITVRAGSRDGYTLYGDGTASRREGGYWVRRYSAGNVYDTSREQPLHVNYQSEEIPTDTPDVDNAYLLWEGTRQPEAAQAFHYALTRELDAANQREATSTGLIASYEEGIKQRDANIAAIEQAARDEDRDTLTAGELDAIRRYNAEVTRLKQHAAREKAKREGIRGAIAKHTYWMGFLEATNRRVERSEQKRRFSWLGRSAIETEVDAHDRPPKLHDNGSVVVYDASLYGVPGERTWNIRADGSARWFHAA